MPIIYRSNQVITMPPKVVEIPKKPEIKEKANKNYLVTAAALSCLAFAGSCFLYSKQNDRLVPVSTSFPKPAAASEFDFVEWIPSTLPIAFSVVAAFCSLRKNVLPSAASSPLSTPAAAPPTVGGSDPFSSPPPSRRFAAFGPELSPIPIVLSPSDQSPGALSLQPLLTSFILPSPMLEQTRAEGLPPIAEGNECTCSGESVVILFVD